VTVLVVMPLETYPDYFEGAVAGYAQDNIDSGRWPETGAVERSRADFVASLPLGPATPDNHLFEIRSAECGDLVGFAWLAMQRDDSGATGFVYDLEIKPEYRRRGHASRALGQLESFAASHGATSVGLHVFAFNTAALALYASRGYEVTGLNMRKTV
jgi:ribosomal protein S18 acetylase RimI-like enzyme